MTGVSPIFETLMETIEDRKKNPPVKSYTTQLFQGGVDRIGCKVMEEAAEVVRAARKADGTSERHGQVVYEAADLMYHLFVLLADRGVKLQEVAAELNRRSGVSGLDEKASRSRNASDASP